MIAGEQGATMRDVGAPPLSLPTEERIALLFARADQEMVRTILREECGNNLPLYPNSDEQEVERIRFAVLKLSAGSVDKLQKVVLAAKTDWRDVLLWAGFANDPSAHKSWLPRSQSEFTFLSHLRRWWMNKC